MSDWRTVLSAIEGEYLRVQLPPGWSRGRYNDQVHIYKISDGQPLHIVPEARSPFAWRFWLVERQGIGMHGSPNSQVVQRLGPFADWDGVYTAYNMLVSARGPAKVKA